MERGHKMELDFQLSAGYTITFIKAPRKKKKKRMMLSKSTSLQTKNMLG